MINDQGCKSICKLLMDPDPIFQLYGLDFSTLWTQQIFFHSSVFVLMF